MAHNNNPLVGFFFALLTATMWGSVPIAVKQILPNMDPLTIVWYRFTIAGCLLFLLLAMKRRLPPVSKLVRSHHLGLFVIAVFGLSGNFILFSASLQYISPTTTQIVVQLSTVGLMLASVVAFKEKLNKWQVIGILILILGLALFFNVSLISLFTEFSDYSYGVMLIALASLIWIAYGLVQKILLKELDAQQILVVIYLSCSALLFFFANKAQIFDLTQGQRWWLLYAGLNTLVGYGALAEAMSRWQVSKVSAVVTFAPLFTLLFSDILAIIWPEYFVFAKLNLLGYIGAFAVVGGAVIAVVGNKLKRSQSK